ncbi:MAG: acyl-ACP--UDP-N-acetylglucosamine O-acyltransferase [Phycisphaerales bacterium]|nr:acyl-ACP--UDP-N-acetylglucosamine O-acyltransferase [Phycisphaerales bacterium]
MIHPTAYVDPQAELGRDVEVGAFSYVGPGVVLGPGCILSPRVTLLGPASFGSGNVFYSGAVLGAAPQDLKYKGGPTGLVVGDDNVFRELVTVHRGTEVDRLSRGFTRIGDKNLLMVGVHVAHDSEVGSQVLIANAVQIAGHVRIEDRVVIGGASAMHHFVTIGRNAYVGGMTRITHDVPPYMKVLGYDQAVRGANVEGLRRWQFPPESIQCVKRAARVLYARRGERAPLRTADALQAIESDGLMQDEHVRYLVDFLRRKMAVGIFGRVREHYRNDSDQDRAGYYGASADGVSSVG